MTLLFKEKVVPEEQKQPEEETGGDDARMELEESLVLIDLDTE